MDVKKILAVATAVVGTVAMADIVSSSVVGYQKNDIQGDWSFNYVCSTFMPVNGDTDDVTLGSLQIENKSDVLIQVLQDGGMTLELDWDDYPLLEKGEPYYDEDLEEMVDPALLAYFQFVPAASAGANGEGWYMQDDPDHHYNMNDWILPFGRSYVVEGGENTMKITHSGSVVDGQFEVDVTDSAFNYLGNCTPVPFALGDLTYNKKVSDTLVQFLQNGGMTLELDWDDYPLLEKGESYYDEDLDEMVEPALLAYLQYVPAASAGENGEGWYMFDDPDHYYNMNDWEIPAGTGFVLEGWDSGLKVYIPSAL